MVLLECVPDIPLPFTDRKGRSTPSQTYLSGRRTDVLHRERTLPLLSTPGPSTTSDPSSHKSRVEQERLRPTFLLSPNLVGGLSAVRQYETHLSLMTSPSLLLCLSSQGGGSCVGRGEDWLERVTKQGLRQDGS